MIRILFLLAVLNFNWVIAQTYDELVDEHEKIIQRKMDSLGPGGIDEVMQVELPRFQKKLIGIEFPFFQVTSTSGKFYSFDQLKGKVILINTWFIGCHPCRAEVPTFNELTKEFEKDGFVILSFGRDDNESVLEFMKEHPMNYPVFSNAEDLIQQQFKLSTGYPTNILLDREGKIESYHSGGPTDEPGIQKMKDELRKEIQTVLKK